MLSCLFHDVTPYRQSWMNLYLAHIEVRAPLPLPITETGYRSHFDRSDTIEAAGRSVAFVLAWLDHEAGRPEWRAAQDRAAQLCLF